MDIREFTLGNPTRNALEVTLRGHMGTPWDSEAARQQSGREVGELIRDQLPAEVHTALKAVLQDGEKAVILINNLPEIGLGELPPYQRFQYPAVRAFRERMHEAGLLDAEHIGTGKTEEDNLLFPYFMNAIYALYDQPATRCDILGRAKTPQGNWFWEGRIPHRDGENFSAITTLRNYERAPLRIIDMDAALGELDEPTLRAVALTTKARTSLYEHVRNEAEGKFKSAVRAITIDREKSPREALKLYEDAVGRHSTDIVLDHGKMALFPDKLLYHQALAGPYQILKPGYARLTVNVSSYGGPAR